MCYTFHMKSTKYSEIILSELDIFNGLYSDKITNLSDIKIDDQYIIKQFNEAIKQNADPIEALSLYTETLDSLNEFDKKNQNQWLMPEEYQDFNIVEFLLGKTTNEIEYQRVVTELELFIQHNMIEVLKYLKYLVDTMRQNNILWGVGRGSSVASFCLYLLDVHRVNSLKYKLDIHEFLR